METRTYFDLIDWSRQLHAKLAECLDHCTSLHENERASALLEYLAKHELAIEKMVSGFEDQADPKAAKTYVYDYIERNPIKTHLECDDHYARLDFDQIFAEVMDFHEQIIELYRSLIRQADIPEASELVQALLDMELKETKLLATQVGRMQDM